MAPSRSERSCAKRREFFEGPFGLKAHQRGEKRGGASGVVPVAGGIDKTTARDQDPAAAASFDRFHRAGTGNELSRRDLHRAARTLDDGDPGVNITDNPVRDQLRRARGRCKASERAGSSRSGGIFGRIERVAASAYFSLSMRVFKQWLCLRNGRLCRFPSGRHPWCRRGAKWRSCDWRRDLVFYAIEPLANLGQFRLGVALHVLDLTRKLGDRGAGFGLHRIETRLQAFERGGIIPGLALRGAQSLDIGFESPDVLGHFLRRAEHLGTRHALLRRDRPGGRRLQCEKRRLSSGKIRPRRPRETKKTGCQDRARTIPEELLEATRRLSRSGGKVFRYARSNLLLSRLRNLLDGGK